MDDSALESPQKNGKKTVKPLSKKKVARFQAEQENCGVLYLSRIPPYLKPHKLRDLLSGMGSEVLRVYLAAEDTAIRARRLRAGGNKKKSFTEGWVEFADKRRAKRIASTLNNTPVGTMHFPTSRRMCLPVCVRRTLLSITLCACIARCWAQSHPLPSTAIHSCCLAFNLIFLGRWEAAPAHSTPPTCGM